MECDMTRIAPVTKEKSPQLMTVYWKCPITSVYVNAINDDGQSMRALKRSQQLVYVIGHGRAMLGFVASKGDSVSSFRRRVLSFFIQHSLSSPSLGHKGGLHGGTAVFSTFPGFGVVLCVVVAVCRFMHTVVCTVCVTGTVLRKRIPPWYDKV